MYISEQDENGKPAVREATPEELAAMQIEQSDWMYPYPIRIVAPKELALAYPQIYVWFQVNDLPIEKFDTYVHLYCNEIMPEHQALVDANSETIKIEYRP